MLRRMRRRHRVPSSLPLASVFLASVFLGLPACERTPPPASFQVRESIRQLAVTHAPPGSPLALLDPAEQVLQTGVADELGSKVFRNVPPGSGYSIVRQDAAEEDKARALTVPSVESSRKDPSFYKSQTLEAGFGYLTMRDGTKLSVYVTFPASLDKGPFPTVVNMSGYTPSRPPKKDDTYIGLCTEWPALCEQPSDPSALISAMAGYATVSVNLRGTGCSGGAYDFFDTLQKFDAYDVIEAVAAQPWVLHNKVGMTGLSYPGISQLFAAAQTPPSLAAITPLSVVGDMYMTAAPGGIKNVGFALNWITRVLDKAGPYKQGWEQAQVDSGDAVCAENQLLHGQKANIIDVINAQTYYPPELADPINPELFVSDIQVPVFLAGAWQDEQTGPYFFALLDKFKKAPTTRFVLYNGVHPDGFAPQVFYEWKTFLDIYVARRVPKIDSPLRVLLPILFKEFFQTTLKIPPDRFAHLSTPEEARKAYEAEPRVAVLFESGGDVTALGGPQARIKADFPTWPIPNAPTRYYFRDDGSMQPTPPTATESSASFAPDPTAGSRGNLAKGADLWSPLPKWDWKPLAKGKSVAWQTWPLRGDVVLIGTASVDLYVKSTAEDADLQVVLSEIQSDGSEVFVQAGLLRASNRALDSRTTPLWPSHAHLEKDAAKLPKDKWTLVRVGIPAFAHAFRGGTSIRLSVDTPGGNHAEWRFQNLSLPDSTVHQIGQTVTEPSSVLLPVVSSVPVAFVFPPMGSLRGQPARKNDIGP